MNKRKFPSFATQQWNDVFFMHWRVQPEVLQSYIPEPLELDLNDGSAWITVVCFVAKQSRLRHVPLTIVPEAIQTNVRTYVRLPKPLAQERGVYFLNVYLNKKLAVIGARRLFHLPFETAQTTCKRTKKSTYTYKNIVQGETKLHASFQRKKQPSTEKLTHFLTERYAIWHRRNNRLIKIPIAHIPWRIKEAEVTIHTQQIHPLIKGKSPALVHAGDVKLSFLYPFETIGYYL